MSNLDPVKNFAKVNVSTGYDASALSVVLSGGYGAALPQPSTDGAFNLVWWNSTDYADPSDDPNKEIVRVTARSTDTLTITRAQEGTSAATHNTGGKSYKMLLTGTKKTIDDINTNDAGNLKKVNNLADVLSVVSARGNLGLGTLATQNGTFSGTSSGTNTGDQTDATLPFTDNTTNNVTTSKHGYVPKAPNDTLKFLRGDATWASAPGVKVYNVKDYGAVGNDSTDDTTSIQAAFTAATATGGVIYFPAGTYKISTQIALVAGCSIRGDGQKVSFVHQTGSNKDGFKLTSGSENDIEISIRDITLLGTGAGTGIGINITGVPLDYLSMVNVEVQNFGSHGIFLGGPIVSYFNGVVATINKGSGIFIDGNASAVTSVHMSACYANANTASGIKIRQATYISLNGCAADSNVTGYDLIDIAGGNLSGCGAEENTTTSFRLDGVIWGSIGVIFNGCFALDSGTNGYYITGVSTQILLNGCVEEGTSTRALLVDSSAQAIVSSPSFTNAVSNSGQLFIKGITAAAPATSGTMTLPMLYEVITITPTNNCTFNATGGVPGAMLTLYITTSGTSSYTMTFGTNIKSTGTLATGTVSAKVFTITFICKDGTSWAEVSRTTAM